MTPSAHAAYASLMHCIHGSCCHCCCYWQMHACYLVDPRVECMHTGTCLYQIPAPSAFVHISGKWHAFCAPRVNARVAMSPCLGLSFGTPSFSGGAADLHTVTAVLPTLPEESPWMCKNASGMCIAACARCGVPKHRVLACRNKYCCHKIAKTMQHIQ